MNSKKDQVKRKILTLNNSTNALTVILSENKARMIQCDFPMGFTKSTTKKYSKKRKMNIKNFRGTKESISLTKVKNKIQCGARSAWEHSL